MTKIIWMSDPHFQTEGLIDGLNPRTRLDAAIEHANTYHADADFAVMSGDLVGDDIEGDYAALAKYLAKSKIPIHPMMGNNDQRAGLRKYLTLPENCHGDFVQFTVDTPEGTVICLDTHKIGSAAGELCADRHAWLEQTLSNCAHKPVYVFMHHPPFALGLPLQDDIMLDDADRFLSLLTSHANINHLFMGHVHRQCSGVVNGIAYATLGSLSFQAPPPLPAWTWDSFKQAPEAPRYGVITIANGNVVIQYMQFCEYSHGLER